MPKHVKISTIQPEAPEMLHPREKQYAPEEISEYKKKNLRSVLALLQEAGKRGSDIVCTPEDSLVIGSLLHDPRIDFAKVAEPLQGAAIEAIGRIARQHRMYIIASLFVRENERVYNAAVLLDRTGKVVGKYCKTHLPRGEHLAVTPGNEYPVFSTDFGRIGMMICWDTNFPEVARILALNGAQIIFNPTWGFEFTGEINGEIRTRARAIDNCVYLVTSMCASRKRNWPGRSCIIDFDGHILADAGYEPGIVVTADIDLARRWQVHADLGYANVPDLHRMYLHQRRPETYGAMTLPASVSLEANGYGASEVAEEVRASARTKEDVFQELVRFQKSRG